MSQIGFTSASFPLIASSVSGGQQNRPGQNEATKAQAGQDFKDSLNALTSHQSEDVGETSLESDRDADGRDAPHEHHEPADPHEEARANLDRLKAEKRIPDTDQMVGQFLDLDI
ncbi:hypothetical protein [Rubinisphaera italica]|uniref:Uncharacterized protein n=1 Tax=Rubinisphaera italica TaxID=2527969 RepID=A0A5C5XRV5_9PLAN|nr:hypothetical protein [Rubinisphaera italica]TWT64472.1 hypothetical protein Pan54_52360 [Rubinisphaera italica]